MGGWSRDRATFGGARSSALCFQDLQRPTCARAPFNRSLETSDRVKCGVIFLLGSGHNLCNRRQTRVCRTRGERPQREESFECGTRLPARLIPQQAPWCRMLWVRFAGEAEAETRIFFSHGSFSEGRTRNRNTKNLSIRSCVD